MHISRSIGSVSYVSGYVLRLHNSDQHRLPHFTDYIRIDAVIGVTLEIVDIIPRVSSEIRFLHTGDAAVSGDRAGNVWIIRIELRIFKTLCIMRGADL